MPKDSTKPSKKDKAPKVKATEGGAKPASSSASAAPQVAGTDKKASKKDKKNKAPKSAAAAVSATGVVPAVVEDLELDDLFKTSVSSPLPSRRPLPITSCHAQQSARLHRAQTY